MTISQLKFKIRFPNEYAMIGTWQLDHDSSIFCLLLIVHASIISSLNISYREMIERQIKQPILLCLLWLVVTNAIFGNL